LFGVCRTNNKKKHHNIEGSTTTTANTEKKKNEKATDDSKREKSHLSDQPNDGERVKAAENRNTQLCVHVYEGKGGG
jgi:hypothetical protein